MDKATPQIDPRLERHRYNQRYVQAQHISPSTMANLENLLVEMMDELQDLRAQMQLPRAYAHTHGAGEVLTDAEFDELLKRALQRLAAPPEDWPTAGPTDHSP